MLVRHNRRGVQHYNRYRKGYNKKLAAWHRQCMGAAELHNPRWLGNTWPAAIVPTPVHNVRGRLNICNLSSLSPVFVSASLWKGPKGSRKSQAAFYCFRNKEVIVYGIIDSSSLMNIVFLLSRERSTIKETSCIRLSVSILRF